MNLSPEDETELKARMGEVYYNDAIRFVKEIYDWNDGSLKSTCPDEWQEEVLQLISQPTKDSLRIAISSGHGIGKTTQLAWIIHWFMSTRVNPQIVVTAGTQSQLITKTWRELAKWQKLAMNGHWFEWTATKYYLKEAPDTWFASAIPWSANNPEAFAGTHEKHVLVIYDEASAIDDVIWEVTEGAMTTPGAIWLAFGNPTKNTGRFRDCFGKFSHRWVTRKIDSRKCKMANNSEIENWIKDYGEDSDFIRVRVRGEFPKRASNQFIPSDQVEACMNFKAVGYERQPIVLGCDIARFGDDKTVISIRQGRKVYEQAKFVGKDLMEVANIIVDFIRRYDPVATVVDSVGIGAGVVDRVRQLGYDVHECNVGTKPSDEDLYANLRIELWDKFRKALRDDFGAPTLELPNDLELKEGLTGIEYGFLPNGKMFLEKKSDMKKRGLPSPDEADSIVLTYAYDINEVHSPYSRGSNARAKGDYIMG